MGGVNVITKYKISSHSNTYESSTVEVRSAQCSLTEISKYHFNFCRQHQITYFISCPVKHNNATCRISFASVVQPCLPPRLAFLPTDSFNYGSGSDHITVNSPRESNGRASCLAARCVHFMAQSVSRGTWKLLLFFFVSFFFPCQPQTPPPSVYVLTSASLSLELLLMEGLDSPHGLSLSLQLFWPGFSCQNMRKSWLNTKKQVLTLTLSLLSAEIGSQICEDWQRNRLCKSVTFFSFLSQLRDHPSACQ